MAQFDYHCQSCNQNFSLNVKFFERPRVKDILCPVCHKPTIEEIPYWLQFKKEDKG